MDGSMATTKKGRQPKGPASELRGRSVRTGPVLGGTEGQAQIALATRIGRVIKKRRLDAGLTLSELSAGADLSSAMLSRIENGVVAASLDTLERLSQAAGLSLADLFRETETHQGSAQLIRRKEQMEVVRSGTKYGHVYRLLSFDRGPEKLFDAFFIEMDRTSESYPRFSHPGTEFIYMLEGRMEYRFGDRTYLIQPGDAFTFSGGVVHGPVKLLDAHLRFITIIMYQSKA